MFIKFNYTLSKSNAFLCADLEENNLFKRLDKINDKLLGYFTISAIGFNQQFQDNNPPAEAEDLQVRKPDR